MFFSEFGEVKRQQQFSFFIGGIFAKTETWKASRDNFELQFEKLTSLQKITFSELTFFILCLSFLQLGINT